MQTGEDFDREWDRVIPAFKAWSEKQMKDPKGAEEELKSSPNGELIKHGHDLELVYSVWRKMYQSWLDGRAFKATPWNENENLITCMTLSTLNVFTGECNDMPDWRTDNDRARDDKVLQDYRARSATRG